MGTGFMMNETLRRTLLFIPVALLIILIRIIILPLEIINDIGEIFE